MAYYIGTEEQCNNYNDVVTAGEGYSGTTSQWASARKHPVNDEWAILANGKYTDDDMTLVEELDESWTPPTEEV